MEAAGHYDSDGSIAEICEKDVAGRYGSVYIIVAIVAEVKSRSFGSLPPGSLFCPQFVLSHELFLGRNGFLNEV